jgi:hypothetical protein
MGDGLAERVRHIADSFLRGMIIFPYLIRIRQMLQRKMGFAQHNSSVRVSCQCICHSICRDFADLATLIFIFSPILDATGYSLLRSKADTESFRSQ